MCDVFVYGTLLLPRIQRRVTGREFEAMPARVHGFARRRVRDETYPTLVPAAPSSNVDGALLGGVDAAALARLDAYEGDAYERISVRALRADGAVVTAWLWLLRPSERHRISDEPWDLATFVAHDLTRFEAEYEGLDDACDGGERRPM
jgi:gamma-glutamylcyclotransferase (GGCT)/AIG2-like uncharacterized protein YtfP